MKPNLAKGSYGWSQFQLHHEIEKKNPETKTLKNNFLEKFMLLLGAFKTTLFIIEIKIKSFKTKVYLKGFKFQSLEKPHKRVIIWFLVSS
jgi:hypothetical protein